MAHVFDIPDFKSEQEEAEWWDTHQDELADAFEGAAKDGTLRRATLAKEGMKAFEILANVEPIGMRNRRAQLKNGSYKD